MHMKRMSLQLLLGVSVVGAITLSGIVSVSLNEARGETKSRAERVQPTGTPSGTPTSTPTGTPTSTPTSTPTGVGYDWSHISVEAGVVSNNPFKINQTPASAAMPAMGATPAIGATPAQFRLGKSDSTDVKGFVLFRWRDQKAWDCASVPNAADDPDCKIGNWSDLCDPSQWHLRNPDFDGRFGITFGGSSSSTSASTVAGTGDVSGTVSVSEPLIMWRPSHASAKPAFLSLGPGFVFDGNTDRGFQDTHTSYALGFALIGGTPWTLSPNHALEVALHMGLASVEVPTLLTSGQNPIIATNSIGEPRFQHVWASNLNAEVQAPLSDNGGYLTLGGEFFGNAPSSIGGSTLRVKPWTLRLGMAVPFSKIANLFTDAANTFNPASAPAPSPTTSTTGH